MDQTPFDADDSASRPGIGDLFAQLVDDTTAFVRAEVALYRAQAGQKALSAGVIVGLLGGAVVLLQGATIALLVGLVMALSPIVGTWWAVGIVVVTTIVIAIILAQIGVARITNLINPKDDK